MADDVNEYARYFPVGKRVRIGIPLSGGEVFREWALTTELDQDLLEVQLSRDVLPENVQVRIGNILELRVGKEGSAFYCRAIIVSESTGNILLMRLIGNVISDELREYFRIDIYLPVLYTLLPSHNEREIRARWEELRLSKEIASYPPEPDETPSVKAVRDKVAEHALIWESLLPIVANISGGGMRINIPEQVQMNELLALEIFIPTSPPRILDIVGQVVYVSDAGGDKALHATALRFKFIDEKDRDTIIGYISAIQLLRLREMRKRLLYTASRDESWEDQNARRWGQKSRMILLLLLSLVVMAFLVKGMLSYYENREKHEIEKIFEESIKTYINKQRR
jgi:hypothetical protein